MYSYQASATRRAELAKSTKGQYDALNLKEAARLATESREAAEMAVRLKTGETISDLGSKGFNYKTKKIMAQDFFKTSKIGPEDASIQLFSESGGNPTSIPGSDLIFGQTPQVNPDAYASLGQRLMEANPNANFGIKNRYRPINPASTNGTAQQNMTISDMTTAELTEKIGKKYASQITDAGGQPVMVGESGSEIALELDELLVQDAHALVGGELKLAEEMGTWGTLGKSLGPLASVLSIGSGVATLANPRASGEEKAMGGISLASGVMTGTGAVIGATGGTAALGGALSATAATNFWNPVGWGIGIGAGLYGIGKGVGLF